MPRTRNRSLIVPANATTVQAPAVLNPGQVVTPLPNFAAGIVPYLPPPYSETFSFGNPTGPGPAGTLNEIPGYDAPSSPFGPGGTVFAYAVDVTRVMFRVFRLKVLVATAPQ